MTSSYGERINPVLNKKEFHNGIDISVPQSTNLKAVKQGVISEVGVSETFGNFLKYKTSDNYTIMYAHLEKSLLKAGKEVDIGQIIALSGNTGLTTGPHLHISIWQNEKLTDPMNFFDFSMTDDAKKEYAERGVILQ